MGCFTLCRPSARTYAPSKAATVYAEEGPGPLTRGTTKISEVGLWYSPILHYSIHPQSVQKVDEANVQLCRKCQQHLSPATMSTLTTSHNATVQRLNDRVASANDALLKQQAFHAEKDEALEQARLQLQQLQIGTNGLKGKARVLDIVSRELGARCEALGLDELPSVDLASWQSCADTNSLPDHCIAMCRTLLQQVKALDLARDIALEELSHLQQKVDVALEAHKKAEVARAQAEALAQARGEALQRANLQSREHEMEHDMLQRALARALKELDMQREASGLILPSPLRLANGGSYTPMSGASPRASPARPALLQAIRASLNVADSAPLASLFGSSTDTGLQAGGTVAPAGAPLVPEVPPTAAPEAAPEAASEPVQPPKKVPVIVPPIKLDLIKLQQEQEGSIGVAMAPPARPVRAPARPPIRASTHSSAPSYSTYTTGTTQRSSRDRCRGNMPAPTTAATLARSALTRDARGRPDQAKLPSFARETASSRTKVVATPSPRHYPNQLRTRPAPRPLSARTNSDAVPVKRPVPASVLQAKAARDAALGNSNPMVHDAPLVVPTNVQLAAPSDVHVVSQQPPRMPSHKSMMSKVERLLAGVWNSPDRQQSRKALKRAAPETTDAPLAAGRPDVQTQPKASSPALLSPPDGYRRTYEHTRPSRARSALHTTYLSTNELYAADLG